MCGILGYAGKPRPETAKELAELMSWLFVSTEIRGKHASGFYALNGGEIIYDKKPIPSSAFVRTNTLWHQTMKNLPDLLIAHCRFGTHGKLDSEDNAHPFVTQDESMGFVHNGVLTHDEMEHLESLGVPCETPVDSERMLRFIEKQGDIPTAVSMLFKIVTAGDFANVLLNTNDGKIYAFRSARRPLCFLNMRAKFGVTLFFSTPEIFRMAYIDAFDRPPKSRVMDRIYGFCPQVLYSLDLKGEVYRVSLPEVQVPEWHPQEEEFEIDEEDLLAPLMKGNFSQSVSSVVMSAPKVGATSSVLFLAPKKAEVVETPSDIEAAKTAPPGWRYDPFHKWYVRDTN